MKRFISLFLAFVIVMSFTSCGKSSREKFTDYSFDYFDTVTMIIGYEKNKEDFDENCKEIKKRLEEYHKLYNIYNTYDDINNLCMIAQIVYHAKLEKANIFSRIFTFLRFLRLYLAFLCPYGIILGSVVVRLRWEKNQNGIKKPGAVRLRAGNDYFWSYNGLLNCMPKFWIRWGL